MLLLYFNTAQIISSPSLSITFTITIRCADNAAYPISIPYIVAKISPIGDKTAVPTAAHNSATHNPLIH